MKRTVLFLIFTISATIGAWAQNYQKIYLGPIDVTIKVGETLTTEMLVQAFAEQYPYELGIKRVEWDNPDIAQLDTTFVRVDEVGQNNYQFNGLKALKPGTGTFIAIQWLWVKTLPPYIDQWGEVTFRVTIEDDSSQIDYLPFVGRNKCWTVVRTTLGKDKIDYISYIDWYESVEIGGKNYYYVKAFNDRTELESYLLREENRKVYMYDTDNNFEFLVFDYSLKEGDTYETYSYDEQQWVTYKVLSVGDYTEGPEAVRYGYDEVADTITISRRYLRKWIVSRIDDVSYQKIWIESAGSLEGPFANLYDSHPFSSRDYLIFVDQNYSEINLAFPFYDTMNNIWRGQSLPHSEDIWDGESRQHKLTYEMEGDRLHIYGQVFFIYGGGLYILFKEEQTDDPQTIRIRWQLRNYGVSIESEGFLFNTDFYVPGFDPNKNYIVVDNKGEEHPVINKTPQMAYRPFIEDNKVWVVKVISWPSSNKWLEYYYFDGDTIIDGQIAKRMMYVEGANEENWVNGIFTPANRPQNYVGAFYEKNRKVYYAPYKGGQQFPFEQLYDFTLSSGDSIARPDNTIVVVNKMSGGIPGFKGTYYEIGRGAQSERWLEGVGSESWPHHAWMLNGNKGELYACTVGDEVIYYNSEQEDPYGYGMGTKKRRFDFTHTTKVQPKVPHRAGEEQENLYGEYNDQLLDIKLNPLDDAYLVRIIDKAGQAVYEKAINAGNIVALNIDISKYPEGQYTVTIENSKETFTGQFDTLASAIKDIQNTPNRGGDRGALFNLQGQRINTLQKGLNIVDGKKVWVK